MTPTAQSRVPGSRPDPRRGSIAGARSSRCSPPSSSCGSGSARCSRSSRSTSRSRASTYGDPRARQRRLAGGPPRGRAGIRVAGRPHRAVPVMVVGLVVFTALPLVWTGPLAFILLWAHGQAVDSRIRPRRHGFPHRRNRTCPARRAFGLYGAAQMGGLLFGPAIGAFGCPRRRQRVRLRVLRHWHRSPPPPRRPDRHARPLPSRTHPAPGGDHVEFRPCRRVQDTGYDGATDDAPSSLWNQGGWSPS